MPNRLYCTATLLGPSRRRKRHLLNLGSQNKIHSLHLLGGHNHVDRWIWRHLTSNQHRKVPRYQHLWSLTVMFAAMRQGLYYGSDVLGCNQHCIDSGKRGSSHCEFQQFFTRVPSNFLSSVLHLQGASRFRDKRYHLDEYLRARQIPHDLCKRARTSLHYSWTVKGGMDYKKILDEIPHDMRTNILLHIHVQTNTNRLLIMASPGLQSDQIHGAYLFVQCDKLFIRSLVSKLNPETYAPGETIILEGDVAEHMYYIKTGKVKVHHLHQRLAAH